MKKYCIKESYNHRQEYAYFNDTPLKDEYQNEVYVKASQILKEKNYNKILDIGCGSGFKLVKYFNDYNFLGTDVEPTINWLKQKYPNKRWEVSDFNNSLSEKFDIVICSDVIEHLLNPDELLDFISKLNFKILLLSTPERDRVEQKLGQYLIDGPPQNQFHIREWSIGEFGNYISEKFKILEHYRLKDFNGEQQLVIAEKYESK